MQGTSPFKMLYIFDVEYLSTSNQLFNVQYVNAEIWVLLCSVMLCNISQSNKSRKT